MVSIPDSAELWQKIWDHRSELLGIAHSHPGSGDTGPSYEDLTTFSAVEAALGRRLEWWITTSDTLVLCYWWGPGSLDYSVSHDFGVYEAWLPKLREHSLYK